MRRPPPPEIAFTALHRLFEKQKAGFPDLNDKDVFAICQQGDEAVVQGLFVRKGELNHTERFFASCAGEHENAVIGHILKQYYADTEGVAKQIYVKRSARRTGAHRGMADAEARLQGGAACARKGRQQAAHRHGRRQREGGAHTADRAHPAGARFHSGRAG